MKKSLLSVAAVLLLASFLISCEKTNTDPALATVSNSQPTNGSGVEITPGRTITGGCDPTEVTLIAGQNINAGTINVSNDANYIYVTYNSSNGYVLTQAHLYVGACALIPVNGQGNPIPGHFPYSATIPNLTTYTFQVPFSVIGTGNCGCVAAHCVLVKYDTNGNIIDTQTGWGNGSRINPHGGNWGMSFNYCTCL